MEILWETNSSEENKSAVFSNGASVQTVHGVGG